VVLLVKGRADIASAAMADGVVLDKGGLPAVAVRKTLMVRPGCSSWPCGGHAHNLRFACFPIRIVYMKDILL